MNIITTTQPKKGSIKISFTKEFSTNQTSLTGANPNIILGLKDDFTKFTLALVLRNISRLAIESKQLSLELNFDEWYCLVSEKQTKESFAEMLAYELTNASYEFEKYKKEKNKQTISIITKEKSVNEFLKKGILIGEELNKARELINTPGSHLTPDDLAKHATTESKKVSGVKVTVLDSKKMKALKMNAVLAVGESSPNKPKFICMEYNGGKKNEKSIVFVGKGVTFDTGGNDLKKHMYSMHMDMAGGAIAIHTLLALAKLKTKRNVVCLVPAVENRITGDSYLPGDVVVGMSGQPIEILNTDAEGRVILSDALTYAKSFNPEFVIDLATLTGSAIIALGLRSSALFSNDEKLTQILKNIGEQVKNFMWPMPLYEEYKEDIKSDLGGITNTRKDMKSDGDVIGAAMFLYQFAKDYKWAHIDIAPRMESIKGDNLGTGATAEPLYAMVKFVETF